jgi:SAM-dependent methyltransferase
LKDVNRFHHWYCRSDRWASALHGKLMPWVLRDVVPGDDVLEIGPGPGLTTDSLRYWAPKLTAIEINPALADTLRVRLTGTNVNVMTGDAMAMPFVDGRFSSVVSFTMLHHVPSAQQQDQVLAEVRRVLRPGGTFVGSDSIGSFVFRIAHLFDTMVMVDPDSFGSRLEAAGFADAEVLRAEGAFRFRATRPSVV